MYMYVKQTNHKHFIKDWFRYIITINKAAYQTSSEKI